MTLTIPLLYQELLDHFGHQHWWPMDRSYHIHQGTDPREEVIIGTILTQNTAWTNVEKALANLKEAHILSFTGILSIKEETLCQLIQPSGFFNQKAHRLRLVANALQGNLNDFFSQNITTARSKLLSLNGIGPETADSILLYAGDLPSFVVDAYTRRLCTRLPLPVQTDSYEDIQHFFAQELTRTFPQQQVAVYKEVHALIVECAKNYCRSRPDCEQCPLQGRCQEALKLHPQRLRRDVR